MKAVFFVLGVLFFVGCANKEQPLATSVDELAGNMEVVGWSSQKDDKDNSKKVVIKEKIIYKDRIKYVDRVKEKVVYKPKIIYKEVYAKLTDLDKDGVPDRYDKCPNTPKNLLVNYEGCPIITTLRLNFDFDKYEVKKIYYPEIKKIAEILKANPNIKIEIDGYTDDIGDAKYNLILSKKRAEAVKAVLVKMGVDAKRIITKGYGESHPLVPNTSYTNRALNRRVEIVDITNKVLK